MSHSAWISYVRDARARNSARASWGLHRTSTVLVTLTSAATLAKNLDLQLIGPHNGAMDGGVQRGRVAAGGENADPFHVPGPEVSASRLM